MRPSYPLRKAVATVVRSTVLLLMPAGAMAQTVVPLGPFRSVTLRNGGQVILRHASSQRVTLLKGHADCASATIVDGDHLVIDGCHAGCPKGHDPAVEILASDLADIVVRDGGTFQSQGSFPRQAQLRVAVEDGGTIDLRAMSIDRVTAGVQDGGRILTRPRETLVATIARGGVVTYWGNPRVSSSVEKGGAVTRGVAADAERPLPDVGTVLPELPAVPPVPPLRVRGAF